LEDGACVCGDENDSTRDDDDDDDGVVNANTFDCRRQRANASLQ